MRKQIKFVEIFYYKTTFLRRSSLCSFLVYSNEFRIRRSRHKGCFQPRVASQSLLHSLEEYISYLLDTAAGYFFIKLFNFMYILYKSLFVQSQHI